MDTNTAQHAAPQHPRPEQLDRSTAGNPADDHARAALYARRRRYGRPGPKSAADEAARRDPIPPAVAAALARIDAPQNLPGDPPYAPPDHPYGFIDLRRGDARPLAAARICRRGVAIAIHTARLAHDERADAGGPPVLWATTARIAGRPAGRWLYASAAAARAGHAALVAAARAA